MRLSKLGQTESNELYLDNCDIKLLVSHTLWEEDENETDGVLCRNTLSDFVRGDEGTEMQDKVWVELAENWRPSRRG
jgi:hypothetical protein